MKFSINNLKFINIIKFINTFVFINKNAFIFVLFSFFMSSCSKDNLPKYVELHELRVLGLIASSPEVDAGGSTTITPLISDVTETTSLSYEAVGCIEPALGLGAEPTCDGNSTAVALQSGVLNSGNMVAAKGFTGTATSFSVTTPGAGVMFAQRSSQDQFNGLSYLVTYKVTNSAGQTVKSFKRILVSTRAAGNKNNNPVVNGILANGSSLTTTLPAGQALSINLNLGTPAAESYSVQKTDGSQENRSEELLTTWFITDGELKYYRSTGNEINTWTAPGAQPTGRDVYLLSVTRDGRGGLAFQKNCFGTCP